MSNISLDTILIENGLTLEDLVSLVREHRDLRVNTRMVERQVFAQGEPASPGIAVALDTESTGKDSAVDRICELGMVKFQYDRDSGQIYRILDVFNKLKDPGIPITPGATAVNHITDEMVKGHSITTEEVEAFLQGVDFCVAHNSKFDRRLCEREFPVFATVPWACSLEQLDWAEEGTLGGKLEVIALSYGFFYEGHRAEVDCRALIEVLASPLPKSGRSGLAVMLERMNTPGSVVYATDAPYEFKDVLKGNGYKWFDGSAGNEKAWGKEVISPEALELEVEWLKANVYSNRSFRVKLDRVDKLNRFSGRRQPTPIRYC